MDHEKRLTLALALCFLLALIFFQPFAPQAPQKKKQQAKPPVEKKAPANGKPEPRPKKAPPGAKIKVTHQADKVREIEIQSDQVLAVLSNRGATVQSIRLKQFFHKYAERKGKDWQKDPRNWLPLFPGWSAEDAVRRPPEHQTFELISALAPGSADRFWVARADGPRRVIFELGYESGLHLTKTIELREDGRSLLVAVEIANRGKQALAGEWTLRGPPGILREVVEEPAETGVWIYQAGKEKDSFKDPVQKSLPDLLDEQKKSKNPAGYRVELAGERLVGAALHDKYFAGILWVKSLPGEGVLWARPARHPPDPKESAADVEEHHLDRSISIGLSTSGPRTVEPGKSFAFAARLEVGSREALTQRPFEKLLDYGFFGSISHLLVWVLGLIYKAVGNYGWAIILLTLLIKILLYPLTRKQQVSMHVYQDKIKKFQPEMEKLKEKHKNNKQKMNEELLKLYRKHNVQPIPLGGCLPILVQIPIFFGLFRALQYSIALRQAPFLWAQDLASPDRLVVFSQSYLLIGNSLNLLPIVMTIVWFIQQKMMPKPTDPQMAQQQKMMMFMPIIFGFMLYGFAAGLCLYWTVSNLIGIIEQKYIKAHLAELAEKA